MGNLDDLQMMLKCCEKLLKKAVEDNPKSGLIVDKGLSSETRMRYSQALKSLKKLDVYFGLKGCRTLGTCLTCENWDTRGFSDNLTLGKCRIRSGKKDYHSDVYHAFDACDKHKDVEE